MCIRDRPENLPDLKTEEIATVVMDAGQDVYDEANEPVDNDIEGGGKDEKAPEDAAVGGEEEGKIEKDKSMETPKEEENNLDGSPALNTEAVLVEEVEKQGSIKKNAPDTAR